MKILRNFATATKMMLAFGLMGMALVVIGWISTSSLATMSGNLASMYTGQLQPAVDLAVMRGLTHQTRTAMFRTLATTDTAQVERGTHQIRDLQRQLAERRSAMDAMLKGTPLSESFARHTQLAEAYQQLCERSVLHMLAAGHRDEALASAAELSPRFDAMIQSLTDVIDLGSGIARRSYEESQELYGSTRRLLLVFVGLGALLGLASGGLIASMIDSSLKASVELLKHVADGDLSRQVELSSSDEVGQMIQALNRALGKLQSAFRSMGSHSLGLASSSEELSAISNQMSSGAEQTSVQATAVSAASEQVNRTLQTVASAAEQMTASVKEIARQAGTAAQIATQAVVTAGATNSVVAKLGESSRQIGEVVKVITSIAGQTNLLALNATIEAARAGDAGKGFGVVASEVKELARETARATQSITQKIDAIQADTARSMGALGSISDVIQQINDIQNSIASAVEEQMATTRELSRNVVEAARNSSDIARGITAVAHAARETSRGAASTKDAAQELAGMSAQLQHLVSQFRTDAETPR